MANLNPNPLASDRGLTEQLKGKSRRRRESLSRLSQPSSAPRAARNDLLPTLGLVELPLDALRSSARKVRKLDPAHVRDVAASIAALGFCAPALVGKDNLVLDGDVRIEAARLLGLARVPCVRVDHLSETEQRTLRLAINRLGEKGEWNLDALKLEFSDLISTDAPIEVSGFTLDEIDHIVLCDEGGALEQGPLAPDSELVAVARRGDIFDLGLHRIICGDATDTEVFRRLVAGDNPVRLLLTDEPYNVPIAGHVSGGAHREFVMASGEMTDF